VILLGLGEGVSQRMGCEETKSMNNSFKSMKVGRAFLVEVDRICQNLFFFLRFYLFIYLTERERDSEHKQGEKQAEAEGEADSPQSRDPDLGLNPRTLRSWSEPKADG